MIPIQFEYVGASYDGDLWGENTKHFITVLEVFTHHYSGELMYKVRDIYIESPNISISREYIINEAAILDMLRYRIN